MENTDSQADPDKLINSDMADKNRAFDVIDTDRIIEMAWEDRTPFDAIKLQFGISEQQVIELMRKEMKASSFKMWRQRVQGLGPALRSGQGGLRARPRAPSQGTSSSQPLGGRAPPAASL